MRDPQKEQFYGDIWTLCQARYFEGFIVGERGLQATLYAELQAALPEAHVVVEPTWEIDRERLIPDLVIVEEEEITDIFEIKFVPYDYANWKDDIKKLLTYVGNPVRSYPVRLDPNTGQSREPLPVRDDCCLHFVVVAQHDAEAVWPLPPLGLVNPQELVNHWFGRTGNDDEMWDIQFA